VPNAQRLFFKSPMGTSVYDFDQGRVDSKNIGFIDGRVSSVEQPSGVFAMFLDHNLDWGIQVVNAYPLQADPTIWFLGSLLVLDLYGIETIRGGVITGNGKKQTGDNPAVPKPDRFLPLPIGRPDQLPRYLTGGG
jgi:hypothetical protein